MKTIVIHRINYNWTTSDECARCTEKICCVVFDIFAQGSRIIKSWGKKCEHMDTDGQCCIHWERTYHHGYKENCIHYSCKNIGPVLSDWINRNWYSVVEDSLYISHILPLLSGFVTRTWSQEDRYEFIREVILEKYRSIEALFNWCSWNNTPQEEEFYNWRNQASMKNIGDYSMA